MSAGNRRGRVRGARSELFVRVLVKKWTRSAVAPRARGPYPAGLELALGKANRWRAGRAVRASPSVRGFRAQALAHRTRPPPDKIRPGTLAGGITRRDHGASGPHQPPR